MSIVHKNMHLKMHKGITSKQVREMLLLQWISHWTEKGQYLKVSAAGNAAYQKLGAKGLIFFGFFSYF